MRVQVMDGQNSVNRRASSILPWLLLALTLILGGVAAFFLLVNQTGPGQEPFESLLNDLINLLTVIIAGAVGVLIVARRRRHPIGWLLLGIGLSQVAETAIAGYSIYDLITQPGAQPHTLFFAWVQQWFWTPQFAAWILLLLLYPTGRLVSRRWRIVAAAGIVADAGLLLSAALTGKITVGNGETPLTLPNPFGVFGLNDTDGPPTVFRIFFVFVLVCLFAALISLVLRFRRSQGDERQQLKWFTYAATPAVLFTILTVLIESAWLLVMQDIAVLMVPLAIGVAIFKYRLYDIDILINRTLVYVPLTAILAGIFSASITLSQRLFSAITGTASDAATVLTTLIVVAAFDPLKLSLQNLVDRRFKEAPGPAKQLKAYNDQVGSFVQMMDAEENIRWFLYETACAFDATGGAVYWQRNGQLQLAHTVGQWQDDAKISVPLESNGARLGLLALAGRRNGAEYKAQDRALLQSSSELAARALVLAERTNRVRE